MAKIGDIVKSYLKIYEGKKSKHEISRLILKENPDLYPDLPQHKRIDNVRARIRYYTGSIGDLSRFKTGHSKEDYFEHQAKCNEWNKQRKEKELKRLQEKGGAKILLYDIETLPLVGPFWRCWKQNISWKNLDVNQFSVVTWAAKWLFEDNVIADKMTPEEAKVQDDKRVITSLCNLIEEADIIVAHNGDKFDLRQINGRRAVHKMPPMLPFQTIDTLKHSRKAFDYPSHSLGYLAKIWNIEQKLETEGMSLWIKCMNGDEEAINDMLTYNIQDVRVQEDVYLRMRPYIKPHPNIGLHISENVLSCPTCGSSDITWGGQYHTYANAFDAFRCDNCGAIGRSRNTALDADSKRFLTMSIPK